MIAPVQLAAEHEAHAHAGADRQERKVVDTAGDAGPPLADRGEVDVVLERDVDAELLAQLPAEGAPFEARDVRGREVQRGRPVGIDHAGHSEHDSVDPLDRERSGGDQRLAQGCDRMQRTVGVGAAQLDVLTRAYFAGQVAHSTAQEAGPEVEPEHVRGLRDRLEEHSTVAGAARPPGRFAHEPSLEERLERERDGGLRDVRAA